MKGQLPVWSVSTDRREHYGHNKGGFNAPSREAIYFKIMKFSEGDQWEYDYETFVAFDKTAREKESNKVKTKQPAMIKDNVEPLGPPEFYDNSIDSGEALGATIK